MPLHLISPPPDGSHLLAGRAALERGAWEEARAHFRASLEDTETPEALEGLALAALGVSDLATTIEAHERAYAIHRERGDRRAAARLALALMFDHRSMRGDAAVGDGWLERARELLEGLGPVPERGWLLVRDADVRRMPAYDFAGVLAMMAEAREIARAHGDTTLEMEVLALEGAALLRSGEVAEGLRRLDQAAAAVAGGEVAALSGGAILCQVLSAYDKVRDYDRATQWVESFQAMTARHRVRALGSLCRNYYAGVLVARGRWTEAEAALAVGNMPVPWVGQRSIVRLGELRLRQGRCDEARALFEKVAHHPESKLGMASLALYFGDARKAADLLDRHLRQLPAGVRIDRARALALAVRAHGALGECDAADQKVAELEALAAETGTAGMLATARAAAGELAALRGDHESARRSFEDAVDAFARAGMPYERASARLSLAQALAASGREAAALEEAARAREEFDELGAPTCVAEAAGLEARLKPACGTCEPSPDAPQGPPLSRREVEVLGLVAQGMSNKEVAARLFLSEHTVKRHLANIMTRLGLPSRAAAAAYAVKNELV